MQGTEFVVGGGNSAGQAALHLARYAARVTILIRSDSLSRSMSDYLIREIGAARNVNVRPFIEVVGGGGDGRLEWLDLRDRRTGEAETVAAAAVFVLIGAWPNTNWLEGVVARDRWGYVLTGDDLTQDGTAWPDEHAPLPFETSLPGVFAVGDVRRGSVKRVASAVGEGSIAVRSVHDYPHCPQQGRNNRTRSGMRRKGRNTEHSEGSDQCPQLAFVHAVLRTYESGLACCSARRT